MANRSTRSEDTREAQSRKKQWVAPSTLGTPDPPEGYTFKWVRFDIRGRDDSRNIMNRRREGWEPVQPSELPEGWHMDKLEGQKVRDDIRGAVVVGDLVLCKMPNELVAQRNAHYREKERKQRRSVESELMKHSTRAMPVHNESSSTVTRGVRTEFQEDD